MFCCFPRNVHIFTEAYKALAAGGFFEIQDIIFDFKSHDGSLEDSALEDWAEKLKKDFWSKGIDLTCASKYEDYFEAVGFENVQHEKFMWPEEEHLKNLGRLCQENICSMLDAISIVALTEGGPDSMSEADVNVLLAKVQRDLYNPRIHAYLEV